MKRRKLKRRVPRLPLLLRIIRGGVGKEFVIKHYSYGPIKTKFPDMSRVIATAQQRKCRNLFKEAVAYAKTVIADPEVKARWKKRIKRKHGVFNAAIKEYMLREKRKKELDMILVNRMLYKCFHKDTSNMNYKNNTNYTNIPKKEPHRIIDT